jgi:SAM-dependent methyltransferase
MGLVLRERLDLSVEPEHAGIVREHLARYEFASSFVKGKNVLDVACGTGYGAAMLMSAGATDVCGVDLSREAIEAATRNYAASGIRFIVGNAEEFSLSERFDVVVSFETIEHLPNPEKFLSNVVDHLVPDGTFLVSTPSRQNGTIDTKPSNPFHVREWNPAEFRTLLVRSLSDVTFYAQYELVKRPFPYSRTLQRKILRFTHPGSVAELDRYSVTLSPPPTPALLPCTMAYIVAVCKNR